MLFFFGSVNNLSYFYKTKRVKKKEEEEEEKKNKQKKRCVFVIIYFTFPVLLASTYDTFEINKKVYLYNAALMTVFDILFTGNVEL